MTEELKEIGLNIGHRRVGRLMRQNGISVVRTRKHKVRRVKNLIRGIKFTDARHTAIISYRMSLKIDPCATLPMAGFVGGYWSDIQGIFARYLTKGIKRQDAHLQNFTADWAVLQYYQEVSAG